MAGKYLDEKQYYNLVAGIAILKDCRLISINFPQKIINIAGPPDALQACSAELKTLLGEYLPHTKIEA